MADEQEQKLANALGELGANVSFWRDRKPAPEKSAGGDASVCDTLVRAGDLAAERGDGAEALAKYREAVESAPRPRVHAQVGGVLLRRVGIQQPPVTELDIKDISLSFELDETLLDGPVMPPAKRRELVNLAMDAYGRAYAYHLLWADETDPPDVWLVLDGLRIVLSEIDRWDLTGLVCDQYDLWVQALSEDHYDWPNAFFAFERRFAETKGFIQGRQVEGAVQQAVEAARRKVVLTDPDAFAEQVATNIIDRLGPVPVTTRAQIEDDLKAQLGHAWTRPPDGVREQIIEAEWLRSLLEVHEGRDYTSVVVFYGKALESLLRYLSLSNDILSEFRRQLVDERIKVRWLSSKAPKQVTEHLVAAIDLRNPAVHGESGPYRPVRRSRMTRMRQLVIGSEPEECLLTLLHKHANWP